MGFVSPFFISETISLTSSKMQKISNYKIKNPRKSIWQFGISILWFNFETTKNTPLQQLNFPQVSFRFKSSENKISIFDVIRKRFIVLQPEEWVRQHCIHYLINEKKYPKSLINVEKELVINTLKKRYDIVVFNPDGSIHLIVECKSHNVTIDQSTFDQIAQYNLVLNASYLMITNGLNHYYCQMDFKNQTYQFLKDIPDYQ